MNQKDVDLPIKKESPIGKAELLYEDNTLVCIDLVSDKTIRRPFVQFLDETWTNKKFVLVLIGVFIIVIFILLTLTKKAFKGRKNREQQ